MDSSMAVVTYLLSLILAVIFSVLGLTVMVIVCAAAGFMVMLRYELLWIHQRIRTSKVPKVPKVPASEKV